MQEIALTPGPAFHLSPYSTAENLFGKSFPDGKHDLLVAPPPRYNILSYNFTNLNKLKETPPIQRSIIKISQKVGLAMRMGSADKRRLRRKLDKRGVVFCAIIRQYIWYGELSRKTYNEVDRAFYEPINYYRRSRNAHSNPYPAPLPPHQAEGPGPHE